VQQLRIVLRQTMRAGQVTFDSVISEHCSTRRIRYTLALLDACQCFHAKWTWTQIDQYGCVILRQNFRRHWITTTGNRFD
jgi:hypothetical protein